MYMSKIKSLFTLPGLLLLVVSISCNFREKANQQFGDQHFKTAISLIELYKIRQGHYPPSLDSLQYLGDWDALIYHSVEYKRLEEGYELNLTNGWIGKPDELRYPPEFWRGLGIKKSNLK